MTAAWRTVRVFISSTFKDMQAERDHLVRFVFPRLREELLPRRIHLVDVDLRWGVTGDQDASEVCRETVDECRPRFLCMSGGRYGWVPPGTSFSITKRSCDGRAQTTPQESAGMPRTRGNRPAEHAMNGGDAKGEKKQQTTDNQPIPVELSPPADKWTNQQTSQPHAVAQRIAPPTSKESRSEDGRGDKKPPLPVRLIQQHCAKGRAKRHREQDIQPAQYSKKRRD